MVELQSLGCQLNAMCFLSKPFSEQSLIGYWQFTLGRGDSGGAAMDPNRG